MKRLRSFGAFWYDFVVGDDWRVAVAVAVGLLATGLVAHLSHVAIWWLLPLVIVAALARSLHREAHRHARSH